jgi:hypothetical protein
VPLSGADSITDTCCAGEDREFRRDPWGRQSCALGSSSQDRILGVIDANHLVANSSVSDHSLSVIDTRSLAVTPVQAQGFFAGSVPGGL